MSAALLKGIERHGGLINTNVLVAVGVLIYRISNWANQTGTKSYLLKKIWVRNNAAGAGFFTIGIGLAPCVPIIPQLYLLNNIDNEFDLPPVEVFADLTCGLAALVAGGTIDVMVTVEELG
jgi:hypothetical protein